MLLSDARKILGLWPDDDPIARMGEFEQTRAHLAKMVRIAINSTVSERYQQTLVQYDQALATVREHLENGARPTERIFSDGSSVMTPAVERQPGAGEGEATAVNAVPEETHSSPPDSEEPPPVPAAAEALPGEPPPLPHEFPPRKKRRGLFHATWITIFLLGLGGFAWMRHQQQEQKLRIHERTAFLEKQAAMFIENRRWPDAARMYAEIEGLKPGSPVAADGRRRIETSMAEEQQQFIGYWTGQAHAELEAGRWAEAEAAARQVLGKYPAEKEAAELLPRIASARLARERETLIEKVRLQIEDRDWQAADDAVKPLITAYPSDKDIIALQKEIQVGREKLTADQTRAVALLQQAQRLDDGSFNQSALDLLREAAALAPANPDIAAALEKMSTYGRTLHVPGDFATPAEALEQSRQNDRIILGEGTWTGPLTLAAGIELQGAGPTKTIIQCPALEGCPITVEAAARGVRISGIAFRHETFAVGADRFSAALVQGGAVTFTNCRFSDASGHGLAVIDGGKAAASRCRFSDNGWNGASAMGKGSSLDIRESEVIENFGHGVETWNGASLILVSTRCEGNTRNGVHADNADAPAYIQSCQLLKNAEFGLVLDSAGSGRVASNAVNGNELGGIVIRSAASALPASGNQGQSLLTEADLNVKTE